MSQTITVRRVANLRPLGEVMIPDADYDQLLTPPKLTPTKVNRIDPSTGLSVVVEVYEPEAHVVDVATPFGTMRLFKVSAKFHSEPEPRDLFVTTTEQIVLKLINHRDTGE